MAVLFRLDGCIEAGILATALLRLQWRHPKLRAVPYGGDDGRFRYRFEQDPRPIPFEIRDFDEEEFPWREETRRLLERGFPAAGPLAAVSVLRSRSHGRSELLVLMDHAIADGLSAIALVDDLLTEYARAEERRDLEPCPALLPVTADHARKSGGWFGRLRLILRFLRLQRDDRRGLQTRLPQAAGIPQQSQWEHWVFSRENTTRLVRRCRKEQSSLGGALVAAVCLGIMECLPVSVGFFKWQFPLDIRDRLDGPAGPVVPQDLGCFVSVMTEFYKVSRQSDFWALARYAHQSLLSFVRNGGPSFGYNMAKVAARKIFAPAVPGLLISEQRVTLLANNYGLANVKDSYGSLRPRECTLAFRNFANGPSLIAQGLVMGQRLNLGLIADGLDPAFWEQLRTEVRKQLFGAAGVVEDTSTA
jgi:hypothetical protein